MATVDCPACLALRNNWDGYYCHPCTEKEKLRQQLAFQLVRLPDEPGEQEHIPEHRKLLSKKHQCLQKVAENKSDKESEKGTYKPEQPETQTEKSVAADPMAEGQMLLFGFVFDSSWMCPVPSSSLASFASFPCPAW
jgi:hypothetical protein